MGFLRRIKEQVGYKDPVEDINAKRLVNQGELDDDQEQDDEKPTVVVLKDGDLTEKEAEALQNKLEKDTEERGPEDGRILFKKPIKRKSDSSDAQKLKEEQVDATHSKKKKEANVKQ